MGLISQAAARMLIARAIDKAEALGASGGFAVVSADGVLVSASRMDRGGSGGMARARSKAWISATQRCPSHEHLHRMTTLPAPIAQGFLACSPEARFPGAGGLPIEHRGDIVGGFAASGATVGPFVSFPGADPRTLIVAGRPANSEDLIVAHALDREYVGLHGDDEARWLAAYGALPDEDGLGHLDPPPARDQPGSVAARALADAVIAEAERRGVLVAVAIADRRGDPLQQDGMDGSSGAAPEVALAVAAAAGAFALPSDDVDPALAALLEFPTATVAGGLPLPEGGLGVAGAPPAVCAEIAAAVLA